MTEIEKIEEQIAELQDKLELLKRSESGYYICKVVTGDYDYFDEHYYRAGYMTYNEAKRVLDMHMKKMDAFGGDVFEVSEDDYDKYGRGSRLDELLSLIALCSDDIKNLQVDEFREGLKRELAQCYNDLHLEYPSYMHFGTNS